MIITDPSGNAAPQAGSAPEDASPNEQRSPGGNELLHQPFTLYVIAISAAGLLIAGWAMWQAIGHIDPRNLLLLIVLACAGQMATTTVGVKGKTGITFEVGTTVAIASIPVYGASAAVLISTLSALYLWLVKTRDAATWKKSVRQLAFNIGMWNLATLAAAVVLVFTQAQLSDQPILQATLPWFIAAIIYDQTNMVLLAVVIGLQQGPSANVRTLWTENRWAMALNVLIISVGGGLLAFAIERFDWIGIVIFFLPIFLSAFAFRIYVSQSRNYLEQLEQMVAKRTAELEAANVELASKNDELEEYSQERDWFFAVLSHEMRSPLTTIGLYADMMKEWDDLPESRRNQMLNSIQLSQQSISAMVDNVLELESLRAGRPASLRRTQVNFPALIMSIVEAHEAQAANKQIEVCVDRGELVDQTILADATYIRHIVTNLLSNAIKYTPDGGSVTVTVASAHGGVNFSVHDSGYGISPADQERIFKPFTRLDNSEGRARGTGIGLAIVKQYVSALDGRITVESEVGRGSIFTVYLPSTDETIKS